MHNFIEKIQVTAQKNHYSCIAYAGIAIQYIKENTNKYLMLASKA